MYDLQSAGCEGRLLIEVLEIHKQRYAMQIFKNKENGYSKLIILLL